MCCVSKSSDYETRNIYPLPGRFCWQEGYGGFTYSRAQIDDVYKYIKDQEFHHSGKTFRREYIDYLKNDEIVFDEMYLFEFYD